MKVAVALIVATFTVLAVVIALAALARWYEVRCPEYYTAVLLSNGRMTCASTFIDPIK